MSAAFEIMSARAQLYRRAGPSRAYLDYIRANGLGLKSLGDFDPIAAYCGALAVTPIKRDWENNFEFAEADAKGAELAAVIECFGRDGETAADLVAWPIEHPSVILTYCGRTSMLGLVNVYLATTYTFGKPLIVHRTPLDWLRAGCRGAVIIDPPDAARHLLDAPGRISGKDRKHTAELASLVGSLFDASRFVAPAVHHLREAA